MGGVRNITAPGKYLIHSDAIGCAMSCLCIFLHLIHRVGIDKEKTSSEKPRNLRSGSYQNTSRWKPPSTPELQGQSFVFLRLVESTADLSSLTLPSAVAKLQSLDLLKLDLPINSLTFWHFQLFDLHIESTSSIIFTINPWSFKLPTTSIAWACCMLQGTYWASSPSVPPSCVVMPTNWCTWFMIHESGIL